MGLGTVRSIPPPLKVPNLTKYLTPYGITHHPCTKYSCLGVQWFRIQRLHRSFNDNNDDDSIKIINNIQCFHTYHQLHHSHIIIIYLYFAASLSIPVTPITLTLVLKVIYSTYLKVLASSRFPGHIRPVD